MKFKKTEPDSKGRLRYWFATNEEEMDVLLASLEIARSVMPKPTPQSNRLLDLHKKINLVYKGFRKAKKDAESSTTE